MSLLNVNFVMIYIIHTVLVWIKNLLNFLKDNIFEWYFKKYNRLLLFLKNSFFHNIQWWEILGLKKKRYLKMHIRNLFRLKKELDYTEVKNIRNLFRRQKKLKQLKVEYLEMLSIFWAWRRRELLQTSKIKQILE